MYEFDGTSVTPYGSYMDRLESMVEYVRQICKCEDEELVGWRLEVHRRKSGSTAGNADLCYFSPQGKRFRSKNEVQKVRFLPRAPGSPLDRPLRLTAPRRWCPRRSWARGRARRWTGHATCPRTRRDARRPRGSPWR
jgi:hypothetical protein